MSNINNFNEIQQKQLLSIALFASIKAGEAILKIYNSNKSLEIQKKEDNSPLTIADEKSHNIIKQCLENGIELQGERAKFEAPIMSEEGDDIPFQKRKKWDYFWLIDPLDGTKEFINRNGEFTVNIALIHIDTPVLGIVYAPVNDVIYFAVNQLGAYKLKIQSMHKDMIGGNFIEKFITDSDRLPLVSAIKDKNQIITAVASRSHMNEATEEFINNLKIKYKDVELNFAGSSLKLCMVAEGSADIYPRLGPTMEWDTAAAHSIVNCSGKSVIKHNSTDDLKYNKEDLLNPYFVVSGIEHCPF